jgi:hypothetical protein
MEWYRLRSIPEPKDIVGHKAFKRISFTRMQMGPSFGINKTKITMQTKD